MYHPFTERRPMAAARFSILVVEDHPAVQEAMTAMLSRSFPSCLILAADSAEQALELCALQAPELVVMDITLPGMNGIDATRAIKDRSPETLVIMHSSSDAQIYRDEASAAGASAFVAKGRHSGRLASVISGLRPGQPDTIFPH